MSQKLDYSKVVCVKLTSNTPGIKNFKNSEPHMIKFIEEEALDDQEKRIGTTWTWVYDNKIIAGFISLAMFSMDKKDMPKEKREKYRFSAIPSLLIGQLATHSDFECNGLGQEMVNFAINEAFEYSKNIGCRAVALHPLPNVIRWYEEKNSFRLIKRVKKSDIMYLDLLTSTNN